MEFTRLLNEPRDYLAATKEQFAIDVLIGLCSNPKNISAKYFYDDAGSEIFQKITQHPDYYLTRTEFAILSDLSRKLPTIVGEKEIDIIELGAGDGHKSRLVIDGFLDSGTRVNYFPIDISERAMELMEPNINARDGLSVHGVVAEYIEGLHFVRSRSANKQLVLFLGSNIGNFNRAQSQGFLRRLWKSLNADDMVLIGFDMKKSIAKFNAAYNDSAGHTREFNLNLLRRINRELGGNFDPDKFEHFGTYHPVLGAMESYLLSLEEQEVYIGDLERSFHFHAFEPIHLEYSFKFLPGDIDSLSKQTGFKTVEHFTDQGKMFTDSLWRVVKG